VTLFLVVFLSPCRQILDYYLIFKPLPLSSKSYPIKIRLSPFHSTLLLLLTEKASLNKLHINMLDIFLKLMFYYKQIQI
jgi:hypothetical protein